MPPKALVDGSLASFAVWWILVLLLGLLAWPLANRLFPNSQDKGYLAAKPIGILIASYAAWLMASAGLFSFSRQGVLVGFSALAALTIVCRPKSLPVPVAMAIRREALFVAALALGTLIRALDPHIFGLEKFMDFGFMNAATLADQMPPPDPWFAGAPINYYYFGHATAAWLVLASGVPADHGYNLMMGTLFGTLAALVYATVRDAVAASGQMTARIVAAATAACAVLGGNFHTVVYGTFRHWSGSQTGRDFFYYPDSTRFIGFDPPTNDKGFTEMAAYGFAVGDMHGHVLNLPGNVLIVFTLLHIITQNGATSPPSLNIRWPHLLFLGFLLGVSLMTNTWDVVIYGLMMSCIGLLALFYASGAFWKGLLLLTARGLALVSLCILVSLPFLMNFMPFSQGARWVEHTTPVWQLLVLYLHILPGIVLALAAVFLLRLKTAPHVFAAGLAASVLLILALPEIVYLKDIYGEDHMRTNTMFKLSFQGQLLGVMVAGIAAGLFMQQRSRKHAPLFALAAFAFLVAPLVYPSFWLWDRLGKPAHEYTLAGFGFMDREAPGEDKLLPLLRALPLAAGELILEADADSYSYGGRMSALTGRPTALGWRNHEWLWRGDWGAVEQQKKLVSNVYNAATELDLCRAIKRLNVRYVVVGPLERKQYPELAAQLLAGLGNLVMRSGNTSLYRMEGTSCEEAPESLD